MPPRLRPDDDDAAAEMSHARRECDGAQQRARYLDRAHVDLDRRDVLGPVIEDILLIDSDPVDEHVRQALCAADRSASHAALARLFPRAGGEADLQGSHTTI